MYNNDIIQSLPKPETLEEQYIYALVCSVAEVTPKYGIKNGEPFRRMEKYWRTFYEVASKKFKALETPAKDTVDSSAIQNNAVTIDKLANSVANRLLGTGNITEEMLATAVANKLLGSGRVTEEMLIESITEKLLAEDRVTYEMLDSNLKGKIDKIK